MYHLTTLTMLPFPYILCCFYFWREGGYINLDNFLRSFALGYDGREGRGGLGPRLFFLFLSLSFSPFPSSPPSAERHFQQRERDLACWKSRLDKERRLWGAARWASFFLSVRPGLGRRKPLTVLRIVRIPNTVLWRRAASRQPGRGGRGRI
jgi:hypothetical protein